MVTELQTTAANVREMTDAYKFVGAAAAVAGENIESTNALIIALSKAGQMGSEAGVALRSAYVRVLKPTKDGQATMARLGLDYGNYVSGGKRTGTGVAAGLASFGFDVPAADIDKALARNRGSNEKQRKAVFDAVASRLGADQAMDRDAIMKAVDGALTLAGGKTDLTKLLIDLKKAGATQGDLARIFEGRQSVRMLSLLKADLEGILKDVNEGAAGYTENTVAKRQQGLEGATRRLSASWQTFSNTLVRTVTPEIVGMMEHLASAVKNLAATSPATLKLGIGLTAAAAAAGPLMFALGAIGRVGALALTGLLSPIAMVARGIAFIGTAVAGLAVAGLARLGTLMVGLRMLSTFGAGATLAAIGASLGRFALATLLFPVNALRGIGMAMWALAANPVGLIVGALVVGLTALGIWVANNWNGVKEFFSAFGSSFMEGIGGANGPLGTLVGYLRSAFDYVSQLLGPLNQTTEGWWSWGAAVGGAAASGINAVVDAIQRVIGFLGTAIEKARQFGSAVSNFLGFGGGGGTAPTAAANPAPAVAGKRALGGPVAAGKPYLIGERGPELYIPGMSGRIESNNRLRSFTADGVAALAGASSSTTRGPTTITNHWTINGADDPHGVARQIDSRFDELLRQLEGEQRGLLSD
ncbi:phage tail tape measure protein [Nitrobacter sp. TKz-YC02]|uniref:phage tail tape measure protein n=1 Tax=Nitrobacter sp. TKz-YC02 TaxID=3398704 RepID=UPI003CF013F4